jgi:hypothetical protein
MLSQVNRFAVMSLKKHIQIHSKDNHKANSNNPEKRVLNQCGDHFIHPKNRFMIQSKNPLIESANHSTGLKEARSSKGQITKAKIRVTPRMKNMIASLIFTVAFPFHVSLC